MINTVLVLSVDRGLREMNQEEAVIAQSESWGVTVITIVSMRVVHPILCCLNRRSIKESSRVCAIASVIFLTVATVCSQLTTFLVTTHASSMHKHVILVDTLRVVLFELAIWDLVLQPLILAALGKSSAKVRNYLPALVV